MNVSTELLDAVIRSHQGAEQFQVPGEEVRGEGCEAVLGDVDGGEFRASAESIRQKLQAVAAGVQSPQLRQLGDLLRYRREVVDRNVQDLQSLEAADDVRDGGELVSAQDEALEVRQELDVRVDLRQARTLANLQVIEQL